jgi:sulfur carrier protein
MITLQVNGKQVELEAPIPLVLYIEKLGVNPRTVAVEHNGEIIERAQFAWVVLQEGDRVEIVRMVGGGSTPGARRS